MSHARIAEPNASCQWHTQVFVWRDGPFHFGVLLLLQTINGFVGWYEERRAGKAIAALKKELALKSGCKRDGAWHELPARVLVVGDVVHLGPGCVVPADCDLLPDVSGLPIQVDQSALSGESLPRTVYAGERVYQGTIVKRGGIDAIVVATGIHTLCGRASALAASAEKAKSPGGPPGTPKDPKG